MSAGAKPLTFAENLFRVVGGRKKSGMIHRTLANLSKTSAAI